MIRYKTTYIIFILALIVLSLVVALSPTIEFDYRAIILPVASVALALKFEFESRAADEKR